MDVSPADDNELGAAAGAAAASDDETMVVPAPLVSWSPARARASRGDDAEPIITFDVSGTLVKVPYGLATKIPGALLDTLASDYYDNEATPIPVPGYRDPTRFRYILDFYRDGVCYGDRDDYTCHSCAKLEAEKPCPTGYWREGCATQSQGACVQCTRISQLGLGGTTAFYTSSGGLRDECTIGFAPSPPPPQPPPPSAAPAVVAPTPFRGIPVAANGRQLTAKVASNRARGA